jgi:hypothetical protein
MSPKEVFFKKKTRIVTAIQKRTYLTLEEEDADQLTDLDHRNAPAGVLAAPDSPRRHPRAPDVPRRSQSPAACACAHRRMLSALLTFLHAPSIAAPPGSLVGPPNTARHPNAHSPPSTTARVVVVMGGGGFWRPAGPTWEGRSGAAGRCWIGGARWRFVSVFDSSGGRMNGCSNPAVTGTAVPDAWSQFGTSQSVFFFHAKP